MFNITITKVIGLETNCEKTTYIITSCQQNVVKNKKVIQNLSFKNVEKFKYLGVILTN